MTLQRRQGTNGICNYSVPQNITIVTQFTLLSTISAVLRYCPGGCRTLLLPHCTCPESKSASSYFMVVTMKNSSRYYTLPNYLLHLFHFHLSVALALQVLIFIYNGRDDEKLASHSARAMVFDANTTLSVVGVHVTENITRTNNFGRMRITTPHDGYNQLMILQCLIATSR
jgi:hypothetical protein